MKKLFLHLSVLCGLFAATQPTLFANTESEQTEASETSGKKSKKKSKKSKSKKEEKEAVIGPVGAALQNINYFTDAKPSPTATHYFFLGSASWCGPCKAVMPKIVEQYPKMKEAGVEIILVANESNENAKKYLESYKAEFAGAAPTELLKIPGYVANQNGIPNMVLVDAEGNTVTSGHGRMLLQWRQLTNQPMEAGPGEATKAIEEIDFMNGKPNKKANYYIYLHSSSTCVACKSIVPTIVKEYKKMKKGNVEMILLSHDSTPEQAKAYIKENRIKFPALMDTDASKVLPGYTAVSLIPSAVIIDKHGTVIKQGHGSLILEWKSFCP